MKTKELAENHYIHYGQNEKRSYNFLNGMKLESMLTDLKNNSNLFKYFFNIIYNILGKNIMLNNLSYDKTEINNRLNDLPCKYYTEYNKNSFLHLNNKINFNNNTIVETNKLELVDEIFLDNYHEYTIILDTPNYCIGGIKTFTQSILNKYMKYQNFLLIRSNCNNIDTRFSIYINDIYLIDVSYTYEKLFNFMFLNKEKINKIFINNLIGYSNIFIHSLFSLNIKISTITHDHYLLFNSNVTLLYNDLHDIICKSQYRLINFKLFDNIIVQNKENLYLFGNNSDLFDFNKIVISPLPDFLEEDKYIKTNNTNTVIGVIGSISDIKGSNLLLFLIKYFENTDIKIVLFGRFEFNYEYVYIYNNITELNDLLITHKPNMLLELSLCQETYGYTLTLAMITKLPILTIEKPFYGTFENRLSKYSNSHTFNNLKDLQNIIVNRKQDFFYTINPKIFYNKFWDTYFGKESNDKNITYPNLIKPINSNPINSNINIVIITSKIYVSNNSFSYSATRSIYSQKERLDQTLNTIESIKTHIPDYFIILIDNSKFTDAEFNLLNSSVDCFLNIMDDIQLNYYTNKCSFKFLSDLSQQICAYTYIFKHINIYNIKNIFKISGRYLINETFDYSCYNNTNNIFKLNENVKNRDYYYTCFFKISSDFITNYFKTIRDIFKNKEKYYNLDLEVIIGAVFLDDMTLVNNLGITQFLSCWDQIDNI